ncbi:MAG: hypothetical protein LN413_00610 [Candidatus Thermoplasmatota archaeon]|nr:hypothetical protein [Candidatus Thermoplasmatota archaeon]
MALTYQVLSQTRPVAATVTDSYTVPGATEAIVSSIVVCNTSATATSFRISVAINGAADALTQYLYYDVPIAGNDSFTATIGPTVDATDVIRVYATLATLTFTVFGVEET